MVRAQRARAPSILDGEANDAAPNSGSCVHIMKHKLSRLSEGPYVWALGNRTWT